uniref:Uncharacterized protein n=1 Tax=Panagrolaimus sp. ES5 TaxID=591445 RepID=A0AC34FGL1_9BILA
MLANEGGNCEIILLNRPGIGHVNLNLSPFHEINNFWTTSKKENVKVFRGSQSDELLFEYNKSTIEKWNSLMLASGSYTILVPPSKSVAINLNIAADNTLTYPYKGIWATPNYGTPTNANTYYTEFIDFNVSQNIIAQIEIMSFDVSTNGRIEFVDSKFNNIS